MQLYHFTHVISQCSHNYFNSTIDAIIPLMFHLRMMLAIYFNSTIDAIIQVREYRRRHWRKKFQFYYRCNYTLCPSFINCLCALFQFYYRCNYTFCNVSVVVIILYFNSTIDAIIPSISTVITTSLLKFQFYYRCNYTHLLFFFCSAVG